jgi:hypothetical protein
MIWSSTQKNAGERCSDTKPVWIFGILFGITGFKLVIPIFLVGPNGRCYNGMIAAKAIATVIRV